MREFKPTDIPEIVGLATELYVAKRAPNSEEAKAINNFFMKYMDKAIEDCQALSMQHWQVTRPKKDVALNSKAIEVKSGDGDNNVQFVVATTYGPLHNSFDMAEFQKNTQAAVLDKFSDPEDGSWIVVVNRLMFGTTKDQKFASGLFTAIRFSGGFFELAKDPVPSANDPVH